MFRTRVQRVLLRVGVGLAAIVAGLYLVFFFGADDILFAGGDPVMHGTPANLEWAFEDISLPVKGGVTRGWYLPLEGVRGVVFYCHGGGGNISTRLDELRQFRSLGLSVLIFDYAGWGESTGASSERRIYADTLSMWEYLTVTQGVPPEQVIIWGRSFGGGAACELASQVTPAGVVLESTYTSVPDAAFEDVRWFPAKLFVRYRFNNLAKVPLFTAPVLVIHSQDDEVFPYHHGEEIFMRAKEPRTLLTVRGGHGAVNGRKRYDEGIKVFIEETLGRAPG
jgi:hypothetical protein